jgi:hypothetical protein
MGGRNTFSQISESLLTSKGQDSFRLDSNVGSARIIYPAIVRTTEDQAGFNRIQAEIVEIDKNGNIIPGKDRNIPKERLPICVPLLTEFVHARPQVGECVLVIAENPTDITSPRFWLGPLITTQIKLSYQSYQESVPIFNSGSFSTPNNFSGPTLQGQTKQASVLPTPSEIALQGREDADIVLRPREVEIRAGKFKLHSTSDLNTETPCRLQLKQIDYNPYTTGIRSADQKLSENFVPYSQFNLEATNINLISNEGKFREFNNNTEENKSNPRLKDYGDIASRLHPAVFGDELMVILKLILQYLLTHIHTPQSPPLTNNISAQLEPYLNSGKMNDLVSTVVRLN